MFERASHLRLMSHCTMMMHILNCASRCSYTAEVLVHIKSSARCALSLLGIADKLG